MLGLAMSALLPARSSFAAEGLVAQAMSEHFGFNHQEVAVLATSFALVGFSVVAAILLMRTRLRATRNEQQLQSEITDLQAQSDRLRALLFVEPQVLISWAAGDNRPQISGDISLVMSQEGSPQRILAFGTWLPPEPALQMDHAVDALRDKGEAFLLNLSTKLKKTAAGMPPLQLVENPDILATIAKLKEKRPPLVIGFAAETEHLIENAKAKFARKGCDWIVANDVSPATGVMGGDRNTVHLLSREGKEVTVDSWPVMTKEEVATALVSRIAREVGTGS